MLKQTLQSLLKTYRNAARTEGNKRTDFGQFAVTCFSYNSNHREQYQKIQAFKDCAAANGWDGQNNSIDIVARMWKGVS